MVPACPGCPGQYAIKRVVVVLPRLSATLLSSHSQRPQKYPTQPFLQFSDIKDLFPITSTMFSDSAARRMHIWVTAGLYYWVTHTTWWILASKGCCKHRRCVNRPTHYFSNWRVPCKNQLSAPFAVLGKRDQSLSRFTRHFFGTYCT